MTRRRAEPGRNGTDAVLRDWAAYVAAIARRVLRRSPPELGGIDGLIAIGMEAAWRAALSWDRARSPWKQYLGFKVHGALLDAIRKALGRGARRPRRDCSLPLDSFAAPDPCARILDDDEFDRLIRGATPSQRRCLYAVHRHGLTQSEAAAEFGVQQGAVSFALRKARERIRAAAGDR